MSSDKGRISQTKVRLVSTVIVVFLLALGAVAMKILVDHDASKKKNVHMVRLIKPPPPPPVIENKPEPEVKEEIKEPEPDEAPEDQDVAQDDVAPGDQLGLDADGAGGGDSFGLMGKKGGRALIGGAYDENEVLMRKYAAYIRIIEEEISKKLAKKGDIPTGNLQTLVVIVIDERGRIVNHWVYATSGNHVMDDAVAEALDQIGRVSEPPPEGMPRTVKIRVTSPV